jgi:hypothetical protein
MVSFFQTYLLLAFALLSALAKPTHANKRQADDPDWGNYVYMAGSYAGLAGQNTAGVSVPAVSRAPSLHIIIACTLPKANTSLRIVLSALLRSGICNRALAASNLSAYPSALPLSGVY